jgi:3-hydroxyisobutyrate dehydrogenase-like beta-hydroxyacid dehydrogenase
VDEGRTRVGFIGLGRMGLPMAGNLLRAGFDLTVWNRTRERCQPLVQEGARVAADPADLAAGVEVLVTMVADPAAAESVYLGEAGALSALPPGSIAVDMSTIGPAAVDRLAAAASAREIAFLDAPVSGGVSVAEAAQLTAMVGGPEEAFERARPVLVAMTATQIYLGRSGSGATMKLAYNAMIALATEAISEALVLTERAGIAPADTYSVLSAGVLSSPFLNYKRAAFLDPDGQPVAFTTALMQKDLTLALELASALDVPMPATAAANEVLTLARRLGYGDGDLVRVADALRARAARERAEGPPAGTAAPE